jgi:hypothetical protein
VDEIPLSSILTSWKQTGKITADSPGDAKQKKQENETKLIKKKK